ncbi:DEAD-box ATP-dependent RNA helicase 20-like [Pyrus ussuriensis x Pyrus communis]|uniref:RNA helicase n=1 Tax=Pyrus ussuriensis x Pyrus communis TaxID=2448454 RepID=A0A5N5FLU6_9ROSA|nr:DEAD-box ATP-dependent RNA helicase 20-like [Pyrus ussuriensis x Pyrus communis]
MVKRSNDPNEKRSRTRRRLNAVGDGDGDAAQGTSKVRNGRVQLGTKFATLLRVKESTRQRKRKRREITTSVEVQECRHRVKEYRQLRGISVSSSNVPKPIRTLGRTPFPEYVKDEFSKAGFVRPTPIQAQAWPVALEGRDFIGIAPPGSGKTLAYLLPAIVHVKSQKRLSCGDGPIVLILAPTEERARQIQQECTKFAAAHILALLGSELDCYKNSLVACVGILIDTPEAVLHELESCHTNLQRVTYLVVDGADWMLAEEDVAEEGEDCKVLVREVLSQIPPDCQKLFWGSSWLEEADELARPFLRDAIKVEIGSPVLKAPHPIDQIVDIVAEDQKYDKLVGLLGDIADGSRILIFIDIHKGCESCSLLAQKLSNEGYAVSVHENVCQSERVQIISGFQGDYIPIMIATDVAARDPGFVWLLWECRFVNLAIFVDAFNP